MDQKNGGPSSGSSDQRMAAEDEACDVFEQGVEMDRGDENHPEPEPQQKTDKHQGIVLEQAAEACGVSGARKLTPFVVEVAYLGGQVVKRVEPRTF
ncbi:hypothetical protein KL931_004226 [Ogataea haglerorum]|nr:hypothetical protein KL915_003596 [Ogataea haglerorum]KAG7695170.1 hypothetical protein KL951_003612 [Ogataea haglerorum]KAG7736899.1 hypothetical protein KL923_004037 [Ogataea haglerorum]KAG7766388.1 hypothetical protein KL931_004226 [Ogataea haglerorum]KAG7776856.1 hypothetical protein KL922_003096 [Ogataea haglerorum]